MAAPTPYTRSYSFSGFQLTAPSSPLPAPQLDVQLDNIANAMGSTQTALADIRRADGALNNGIVTLASLDPVVLEDVAGASVHAAEAAASAMAAAAAAGTLQGVFRVFGLATAGQTSLPLGFVATGAALVLSVIVNRQSMHASYDWVLGTGLDHITLLAPLNAGDAWEVHVQGGVPAIDADRQGFALRSDFVAWANARILVPGTVEFAVGVGYRYTGSGTVINDLPGWVPVEPFSREHFVDDAAFNAAVTAKGWAAQVPNIWRRQGSRFKIDILESGAIGSNLLSDATNNVGAIQALIDWVASFTNGGVITGTIGDPRYIGPVFALNSPLMAKDKVSFDLSPAINFRAAASMTTMLDTSVGTVLHGTTYRGGFWNGGGLATQIFTLRNFQNIYVGGQGMTLYNPTGSALKANDLGSGCYGLMLKELMITRPNSVYAGAPIGVEINQGLSDSRFFNIDVIGYAYGIQGPLFGANLGFIHTWSAPATQGHHQIGIDLTGGRNHLDNIKVDEAYGEAFFRFSDDNNKMTNCQGTLIQPENHNLRYMVKLTAGATNFSADMNTMNDRTDARFLGFMTGIQPDTALGPGNTSYYGPKPPTIYRGYAKTFCDISVNPGSSPTIVASENIASVTRVADGDYTFNFAQPMPSTSYVIDCQATPVTQPSTLNCRIRTQDVGGFRVQVVDPSDQFVTPAKITVRAGR